MENDCAVLPVTLALTSAKCSLRLAPLMAPTVDEDKHERPAKRQIETRDRIAIAVIIIMEHGGPQVHTYWHNWGIFRTGYSA